MRKLLTLTAALTLVLTAGCATKPEEDPVVPEPTQSAQENSDIQSEAPVSEGEPTDPGEDNDSGDDEALSPSAGDEWSMGPVSHEPHGTVEDPPLITGLRAGSHEGFDRLVVDFAGSDPLGWEVGWVATALEQGRGEPLELRGPAFLDIQIRGTTFPQTEEDWEVYYDATTGPEAGGIRSIYDSSFEGTTHVVIGADAETPFRVFQLEDPLRLVIDVKN